MPEAVLGDEKIGKDEEFSGHGDEGGFCFFAAFDETSIEEFHVVVVGLCAEGCEIENAPNRAPAAPDDAHALALTGIVGDRRQASQRADLLIAQQPEFWQAGDERDGNNIAKSLEWR